MINGLKNIPFIQHLLRVTPFFASVTLLVGVTAMGLARTAQTARTNVHSVAQSALKAGSVELLRDVATETQPKLGGQVRMMEVTAYCACSKCCGPNARGLTASGLHVSYNEGKFVAADSSLAFGTKVLIPGYDAQPVEVIDRGGAIKGNRIDVFYPTHQQALEWGRRTVAVTVFE
jgi:3D (Asp-Asp-Asp) domain-containing protein